MNNIPKYQVNSNLKLGQSYTPYQQYRDLYNIQEALYRGTMFKELYRPYKKQKPYMEDKQW